MRNGITPVIKELAQRRGIQCVTSMFAIDGVQSVVHEYRQHLENIQCGRIHISFEFRIIISVYEEGNGRDDERNQSEEVGCKPMWDELNLFLHVLEGQNHMDRMFLWLRLWTNYMTMSKAETQLQTPTIRRDMASPRT